MANYQYAMRTNYFKVKDPNKLHEIVESIGGEVFKPIDHDIEKEGEYYGFGLISDNGWNSYYDKNDNECDTIECIKSILDDKQICMIHEVGHEKLKYLSADTIFISNDKINYINHISNMQKIIKRESKDEVNYIDTY